MAQTLYFSDADLTARLPSLTGNTKVDTAGERTTLIRNPACAIVDSWFPYSAPFTADPSTEDLIKVGALEIAAWVALRITSTNPADKEAAAALSNAKLIFGYDSAKKIATAQIPGLDSPERFAVVDVSRSILDEDRDEDVNRAALYP